VTRQELEILLPRELSVRLHNGDSNCGMGGLYVWLCSCPICQPKLYEEKESC
jgi:hypothetical protein